ncbi:pentapeptide repeat-containing protein [Streptomyces sp. MS1.AVA.4]|uniref:Pentapeptide repeat-containing protein n=1 Tax=Streptomyces pratisoli TaxID=3139917 RepID=A0ACC6QV63_9ACTN
MYTSMKDSLEERRKRALRVRTVRRWVATGLVVLAVAALLVGLPWVVWKGPYVLDSKYIDTKEIGKGTGSAALVTGLRNALVACVAALGAGIALLYTARTYRLTRRGQVTDRFNKALERLGSDEIYVRIGGILVLEQIVQDAPEQATDAAHVLGHFIRRRAPRAAGAFRDERGKQAKSLPAKPDADVQTALTALTRRKSRVHVHPREALDLSGLHLVGARLESADLTDANLEWANLAKADLRMADLTDAILYQANLAKAYLYQANLTEAYLCEANFTDAILAEANLTGADLHESGTNLTYADLRMADLTGAVMWETNLTNTYLSEANLDGADLTKADLRTVVNLTREQLAAALTDDTTILPPEADEGDSDDGSRPYVRQDYLAWCASRAAAGAE